MGSCVKMKKGVKAKIKRIDHDVSWGVDDAPVDLVSFRDGNAYIHKLVNGEFDEDAWYTLKDYANRLSVVGFLWYKNGTGTEYKVYRGGVNE